MQNPFDYDDFLDSAPVPFRTGMIVLAIIAVILMVSVLFA